MEDVSVRGLSDEQRAVMRNLRNTLVKDKDLKLQVMSMNTFVIWPSSEKKINLQMLEANIHFIRLCAPFVSTFPKIVYIDNFAWILKSVKWHWKARSILLCCSRAAGRYR